MTGPVFMRRGASWVHRRREDDTPGGFAHSICGLSFSPHQPTGGPPMVIELGDDQPVTCPECLAHDIAVEREHLLTAVPDATPRPSPHDAAAWTGPHVEVLAIVDAEFGAETVVFLDGVEVPYAHHHTVVIDARSASTLKEWLRETRDVTRDTTMSPLFKGVVVEERKQIYDIAPAPTPALKEG